MNFIKAIVDNKIDQRVHKVFVRYGLGEYEKEEFVVIKEKEIKVYAGFEYLNFLHQFLSEIAEGETELSGAIETTREINDCLKNLNLVFSAKKRHGKPGTKYELQKQKVESGIYRKIVDQFFEDYLLINIKNKNGEIKVKSLTTPKIGEKTEKFVNLRFNSSFFDQFKKEFLFDVEKDFRKAVIKNVYQIKEVMVNEDLVKRDPEKARLEAKRKGQIKRIILLNGQIEKEYQISFIV